MNNLIVFNSNIFPKRRVSPFSFIFCLLASYEFWFPSFPLCCSADLAGERSFVSSCRTQTIPVGGTHFGSPLTNAWSFSPLMKRYKSLPAARGHFGCFQLSVFMHSRLISIWVSSWFLFQKQLIIALITFPFLCPLHFYSPDLDTACFCSLVIEKVQWKKGLTLALLIQDWYK